MLVLVLGDFGVVTLNLVPLMLDLVLVLLEVLPMVVSA